MAVAQFVVFSALALYQHPECRETLEAGEDEHYEWFVQEVRRFYPFFPFIGGRVMNEFERRRRVLLDLYGTNHDSRSWHRPEEFLPERFRHWKGSAFDLNSPRRRGLQRRSSLSKRVAHDRTNEGGASAPRRINELPGSGTESENRPQQDAGNAVERIHHQWRRVPKALP